MEFKVIIFVPLLSNESELSGPKFKSSTYKNYDVLIWNNFFKKSRYVYLVIKNINPAEICWTEKKTAFQL